MGDPLRPMWSPLRPMWSPLRPMGGRLRPMWSALRPMWSSLRPMWSPLRPMEGQLRPVWSPLRPGPPPRVSEWLKSSMRCEHAMRICMRPVHACGACMQGMHAVHACGACMRCMRCMHAVDAMESYEIARLSVRACDFVALSSSNIGPMCPWSRSCQGDFLADSTWSVEFADTVKFEYWPNVSLVSFLSS